MKVLIFIGTRPEAIKLAILHKLLLEHEKFEPIVCLSGQHTDLVDEVLQIFEITADYCCFMQSHNRVLAVSTSRLLLAFQDIVDEVKPDLIICQGDTLTSYCGSLISYYNKIKLVHVEAGLRTYNKYGPFPEEIFRKSNDHIADFHFAPSDLCVDNLIKEGVDSESIYNTGNTGIDALLYTKKMLDESKINVSDNLHSLVKAIKLRDRKLTLLTLHRRENQQGLIKDLVDYLNTNIVENTDVVFVMHPNPQIKKALKDIVLREGFHWIPALPYHNFIWLMSNADLILTDSGGIQEEAPYLDKPVIVIRNETERHEIMTQSTNKLFDLRSLRKDVVELLRGTSKTNYKPYGNGDASKSIIKILESELISKG